MCYAFRSKSKNKEETLRKHIIGITECLKEAWETEGIKKKLAKIHGINKSVTNDMLLLAGLIHDIGKTESELQNECREECTSFKHHYITSAMLALKLGYETKELNLCPDNIEEKLKKILSREKRLRNLDLGDTYLLIVVLPILLHHYAQVTSELSVLEGLNNIKRFIQIHESCVNEITSIIDEVSQVFESEIGLRILSNLKDIITKKEPIELSLINRKLFQEASSSYEYVSGRIMTEAFTGILNLCDGRVASSNR